MLTILCVAHLEWTDTLFQRPQQVMTRLAERHKVIYFREWRLREWLEAIAKGRNCRHSQVIGQLAVANYLMPLPIRKGRLPACEWINQKLAVSRLTRLVREWQEGPLILWFYFPKFLELIDLLEPAAVVYECMDNYAALARDDRFVLDKLAVDEPRLLARADLVF